MAGQAHEPQYDDTAALSRADAASCQIADLVRDHHQAVYRYAYRLAGSAADAEDLCQQTFLDALRKLHQLREPERARGWLYTILRNCYLKQVRRNTPLPAAMLGLELDGLHEPTDETPIDGEQLQLALDQLPDDFRIVLLLFYFEELSYREIADQLQLPPGTVMSRLSRAKQQVRKFLSERDSPPAGEASDRRLTPKSADNSASPLDGRPPRDGYAAGRRGRGD